MNEQNIVVYFHKTFTLSMYEYILSRFFKSNLPAGTFTALGWRTGSQPALEQIGCDAVTFASAQEILLLMYIFQR